jgi:hypothetical protein
MQKALVLSFLFLTACASFDPVKDPVKFTSSSCRDQFHSSEKVDADAQLDNVSELFSSGCYYEVIALSNYVRSQRRDKLYSVTTEMAEVLAPEGSFTPYILESYERSFLSLFISFSYLNLDRTDDALIELRRTMEEEKAILYNHGDDPTISLMLAALWDRFDPAVARPYWLRLSLYKNVDPAITLFAQARIKEIDADSTTPVEWQIHGVGLLPELEWHSQFTKEQPYKITTTSSFPAACSSQEGLLMPTSSWTQKLAKKYDSSYHPWLYTKSLIRAPIGFGYGVLGVTTGVAVGVGGCGLALEANDKAFDVCKGSLDLAGYLIGKSADVVSFTLKPDLRHWKKLPLAIVLEREDVDQESSEKSCPQNSLTAAGNTTFLE